jgi:hypothetical protein
LGIEKDDGGCRRIVAESSWVAWEDGGALYNAASIKQFAGFQAFQVEANGFSPT